MHVLVKNRIILSVTSLFLITSILCLGIIQCCMKYSSKYSFLVPGSKYCSRAIVVVDRMAGRLFPGDKDSNIPENEKSKPNNKKKLGKLISFILSTLLISNNTGFAIGVTLVLFISLKLIKNIEKKGGKEIVVPPELRFYNWWALKFLSPIQKCIMSRADIFDINPIDICRGGLSRPGKTRTLFNCKQSAGFLFNSEWLLMNSIWFLRRDRKLNTNDQLVPHGYD